MQWIYLSPHCDDIALSCAGLVWDQAAAGESAAVWTICAGDAPAGSLSAFARSLHARWKTGLQAAAARRQEDIASCRAMGASYRHFDLPDCIYRPGDAQGGPVGRLVDGHYYASEEAIFGEVHPAETALVQRLAEDLLRLAPPDAQVVCPLALGGHVDHRLVRRAAEQMGRRLWYYADYPYVLKQGSRLAELAAQGWQCQAHSVSPQGLLQWEQAAAAHASQVGSFWPDAASMRQALAAYTADPRSGLWRAPDSRP